MTRSLFFGALFIVSLTQIGWSQVPRTMSYQGALRAAGGGPVADDDYDLEFKLFDAESGGSELWSELHTTANGNPVSVEGGMFSVILGSSNPLGVDFDQPYWLAITVDGSTLTPRTRLTASPYSLRASSSQNADSLALLPAADYTTDSELAAHTDNTGAHHVPYTDAEAVAAMGTKADTNPLHHDKTTGLPFTALTGTASDAQVPNDITIDSSKVAGNTDSLGHVVASAYAADDEVLPIVLSGDGPGSGLNADSLDGLDASEFATAAHVHSSLDAADGSPTEAVYVDSTGNVGIGTTNPNSADKLHVMGRIRADLGATGAISMGPGGSPARPTISLKSAAGNRADIERRDDFLSIGAGTGDTDPQNYLHVTNTGNV
ncbi:MAG: hypothetical protein JSW54_04195, partial [Fidelibacterota bacterium]